MQKTWLSMLGVKVQALTMSELNECIAEAVSRDERCIIANHNLHSVYLYHHDTKMREYYKRAENVHIDGFPLIYMGKVLGLPLSGRHRVGYIDWVDSLMSEAANSGWRVFYVGSRPGVASRAAEILRSRIPGLEIETNDGYFDSSKGSRESVALCDRVNAYAPHVLMVGMGMPKQEHWILDHYQKLNVNAILNAGACVDYVAGVIPTPPRWLGPLGLEWTFRMVSEPRRLWRRYLLEPWSVLGLFAKDILRARRKRASATRGQ